MRSGIDQASGAGKWHRWCASLPEKDLCTGDSASCRAVGDECPGWITRHGPRVDRWDLRNGECLYWPCVSELPAGDGYELSPIPSRSHGTSDLPLGPPIAARSRETMAAGIPGHIGMEWVWWFPGAANSGHTLPRVDTGSSCPDVHDSRPGDTARFLGSFVRSGHWFVDGTRRINSLILPGGRRNPRQTLEMNWGPLSETMSSGRPKFLNMCWKRDSAVSRADGNPRSGINLQDLENRSTTTRMVVNPFKGGRSVAKSTPRWD